MSRTSPLPEAAGVGMCSGGSSCRRAVEKSRGSSHEGERGEGREPRQTP